MRINTAALLILGNVIFNLVWCIRKEKFIIKLILITSDMKLTNWIDNNVKEMKWYDMLLVKLYVFFITLFLITAWEGFRNFVLGFEWYWYLIIAIILMIPINKKMFFD